MFHLNITHTSCGERFADVNIVDRVAHGWRWGSGRGLNQDEDIMIRYDIDSQYPAITIFAE